MKSTEDITDLAERLLSVRFGGRQKLSDIETLSGTGNAIVLRARVAQSPFLENRSLIIKYTPRTSDPLDDVALLREVVAYQFTTSLAEDVRPGPILVAYDIPQRIIVISDSGDGDTFAELLSRTEEEARANILRNLGQSIGRMHAGTADREDNFDTLQARMLRQHPEAAALAKARDHALEYSLGTGLELLEDAGIKIPATVIDFSDQARRRLLRGQHRAFTPFDLSPDNIIVAHRTHFLDYEWAGFRDATFDIACVVAGFPQFLFSRPISDDDADIFIDAWVEEVKSIWPNVRNEQRLHVRIVIAMVGWALASISLMHFGSLNNVALAQTRSDGDYSHQLPEEHRAEVDVLRPSTQGPFSEEELLVRRDLHETFEALARFAARGSDSRLPVVAEFAAEVAERLTPISDFPQN
ncbi:phosphotransferase [Corynebacterium poyangense]|uniref:Phosphotransferase n=1 Tax=Corynebacterium poyangense TaxID=2684405 RepID=A0A7H0SP36_9CORY|nr:phosphotransferase [Corynebacterium poyangense]MBZ8177879.1 phosphotransferase [Corynebacterium poyangense]QNQ90311.1 phosphotransferase [Corynebacterium poyangense]